MPQLGKKSKKSKSYFGSKKKDKKKIKQLEESLEDEIIDLNEVIEDSNLPVVVNKDNKLVEIEPFSDGIVNYKLDGLIVVPRICYQELDPLKQFLKYFATVGFTAGSIYTKSSFMKRKGGVLL